MSTVLTAEQPPIGDAFGAMLRRAYEVRTKAGGRPAPWAVVEVVERDDGWIYTQPMDYWLAEPESWLPRTHQALGLCRGQVLDVGCGAGQAAVELQRRGSAVTGLDTSPGAIEVARRFGLRDAVVATIDEYAAAATTRYDTFLLLGGNVGLLESAERAPAFLSAVARLSNPGARIVAEGTDPYRSTDPAQQAYHRRNREHGRLSGQMRIRWRHGLLATEWFDYLLCSTDELKTLLAGTRWQIESIHQTEENAADYLAVLELT